MFDTFASLDERMKELGIIFNKEKEVEGWLQANHAKAAAMWENLHSTLLKPGETASVFTNYPGDRLFVMARAGLPQLLYGPGGMKPTAPIQEILDANEGFRLISPESLGEFAGDRIFILDPDDDEAKRSTEALLESPIWKGLPAGKDGHVYRLYNSLRSKLSFFAMMACFCFISIECLLIVGDNRIIDYGQVK